jgi:hypothetical protein
MVREMEAPLVLPEWLSLAWSARRGFFVVSPLRIVPAVALSTDGFSEGTGPNHWTGRPRNDG